MASVGEMFGAAVHHHQAGDLGRAETLYRQIIEISPSHHEAFSNLGMALRAQGRRDEALACFIEVARLCPNAAEAHGNLGNALWEAGRLDDAMSSYEEALRLNPCLAREHNNLGLLLRERGQLAEAVAHFGQAVALEPDYANAHFNLANAVRDQGDLAEAVHCYRRTLAVQPSHANAYQNLGAILMRLGQLDDAAAYFREVLHIMPHHADAHSNLGVLLCKQSAFDQSAWHLDEAVRLNPNHRSARFNRAMLHLLHGDFERGWPGYELGPRAPQAFAQPRWRGEPLAGKTILLHAEQGLGDTIQFIRYAPLVKERGGTVLVECQPAALGLLQNVREIAQVIPRGRALPAFDTHVPIMSLPGIFRTSLATIPAKVPYLHVQPERLKRWQKETAPWKNDWKIGIAWRGNPTNSEDQYRSTRLRYFEPLARLSGVRLFSLQVGSGADELAAAPFPVTDVGSRFDPSSLDDLAAATMCMDLVIGVDSAVVHLAGALGQKTWTLLAASADWRWLLRRDDCPWYPTMRLFRQARLGDWDDVFRRVAEALTVVV